MSTDNLSPDIENTDSDMVPGGYALQDPEPDEMADILDFVGSEVGIAEGILDQETLDKFASGGDWHWEHYQLDYLNSPDSWIMNKGRRMGLSTAFAMKAFARGILTRGTDYAGIFISHNQQEAINKVDYVKNFLYALPNRFKKPIERDPKQLIEWSNEDGTKSRVISHPQKPVRGDEGDIFLDEFAHYQYDKKIFDSVIHSSGMEQYNIDITSTPFGKTGLFYEMFHYPNRYPDWNRKHLKWWDSMRYLDLPDDPEKHEAYLAFAQKKAPTMESIKARVMEFGNENVIRLFKNSPKASFLQEMEGEFIDDEASYFGRDLVMSCSYTETKTKIDDYAPKEDDFSQPIEEALKDDLKWPIVRKYEDRGIKFKTYDSLDELYDAVRRGEISPRLIAGADLGGRRHNTEIVILEEIPLGDQTLQVERFNLAKRNWSLPDQQRYFERLLGQGFIQKLRVDTSSIGQHMEDAMSGKWGPRFEAMKMGGGQKTHTHMSNLHVRFEEKQIAISFQKKKLNDLMAIKREITDNKNYSYVAPSTSQGHSDYAWALAFASLAGTPFGEQPADLNFTSFSGTKVNRQSHNSVTDSKFADDFAKNHLPKPGEKPDGFGELSIDEDISISEFSPGSFNPNHES